MTSHSNLSLKPVLSPGFRQRFATVSLSVDQFAVKHVCFGLVFVMVLFLVWLEHAQPM